MHEDLTEARHTSLWLAALLLARAGRSVAVLEQHQVASGTSGRTTAMEADVPLPFLTRGDLRFDNQVEPHARTFLLGLLSLLVAPGGEVFDGTRALADTETGTRREVRTPSGSVRATDVVAATSLPFLDRGLSFARAHRPARWSRDPATRPLQPRDTP